MAQQIVRGHQITLDAFFTDSAGDATDPTAPLYSIIDAYGDTIVGPATPPDHLGTGHYSVDYEVPGDAVLGAWAIRWSGSINGEPVTVDDGFTVFPAAVATATPGAGSTGSAWASIEDVCAPCNDYGFDEALLEDSLQFASDVLFELTGRRWPGACSTTFRPTSDSCGCSRPRGYGCSSVPEVRLTGASIDDTSIVVKLDGVSYDATDGLFRLDDGRYLVRLDGSGWPCCQDMLADPDADENTFEVSYNYGSAPPIGGVRAAATLGCQLALACTPATAGDCRLPKRITTVTRAGVTMALLDPLTVFKDGLTGLSDVDLWISSVRYGQKSRKASVFVPGARRKRRRDGA
jgi:hypothetical protein